MGKLLSIWLLELVVSIYDYITLPIYYLYQQPWRVEQEATQMRARITDDFTWQNIDNQLDKSNKPPVETLDELFRTSVSTFADRECLGVRKILAVEYKSLSTANSNGPAPQTNGRAQNGTATPKDVANQQQVAPARQRQISKYVLDDKYTWFTYAQIEHIVVSLSAGLVSLCNDSLDNSDGSRKLLICADTCMQWFLTAHACFRNKVTVVTAYTSLDDDAILHIIHQTEVKILVVSQKFALRMKKIAAKAPLVDTIIVLDDPLPGEPDQLLELKSLLGSSNVKRLLSYSMLIARGVQTKEQILSKPVATDIAVLMYTSGSSGKAKGVLLSHKSIVYTALSFSGPGDIDHNDRYIGYLPLGHVLELAAECIFLRNGATLAYSSPLTLTNMSPMIKSGQFGDAYIFKPTIVGAVPLVLDRIMSGIQQAVKARGSFFDQLINDFVVRYKRYWWERYYDSPIMNRLLCNKFHAILGDNVRAICSGGAALSRDTQEYLRHVANYTVLQGYGLTETSAAASFSHIHDRRYNVAGAPYPIVRLKLESWSDYSVHDKPNPRGEIIVGGQPVASGYYKMPELTEESFFVDPKSGERFFRTGDIGMMLPDGVLKIIDRKKDIVKPLSGEYVSLSEIEIALRASPIVENVCAYCSQYSNHIVAIVKPEARELRSLAIELYSSGVDTLSAEFKKTLHKFNTLGGDKPTDCLRMLQAMPVDQLCSNRYLKERFLQVLQQQALARRLKRNLIPSNIKLTAEEWSPESGLVTASFKLRRRELERHYMDDIVLLYSELGQNIQQRAS